MPRPGYPQGAPWTLHYHLHPHAFQQFPADFSAMFGRHASRDTMRVGTCTEQQIMLTHVFQVHLYDIWRMIGMVHLDTIQGDFSAYFIKQGNIVEGKAFLLTPWMCNQA